MWEGVGDSGQTKQFFGRNTETETRPLEKAEISAETEILAETEISADTLFRPKQPLSAEILCFSQFRPTFGPNIC